MVVSPQARAHVAQEQLQPVKFHGIVTELPGVFHIMQQFLVTYLRTYQLLNVVVQILTNNTPYQLPAAPVCSTEPHSPLPPQTGPRTRLVMDSSKLNEVLCKTEGEAKTKRGAKATRGATRSGNQGCAQDAICAALQQGGLGAARECRDW
jgi:hypothetical protein